VAYQLAKHFYKPALKEVCKLLQQRAERFFQIDIVHSLFKEINDPKYEALVVRRMQNVGLLKK
jgi:gluconate kinase